MAPVTGLRSVGAVAESSHEDVVDSTGVLERPSSRWSLRPAKAGKRGDDKIEDGRFGVLGVKKRVHDVLESGAVSLARSGAHEALSDSGATGLRTQRTFLAIRAPAKEG